MSRLNNAVPYAAIYTMMQTLYEMHGGEGDCGAYVIGGQRMSKNQPEYELQAQVAEYLRTAYPKVKFLSDVRASLKLTGAQQMRAKRIQADNFACPDMVIFAANDYYHGLFLEFKAESPFKKNGDLKSGDHLFRQAFALVELKHQGYHAEFYWTFEDAGKCIDWYLAL